MGLYELIKDLKAVDVLIDVPSCYVDDPLAIALDILAAKRSPRRIVIIDRERRVRGVITSLRILEILLGFRGSMMVKLRGLTKVLREKVILFSDEAPYTMARDTPLVSVIKHMGENSIPMIPIVDDLGTYVGAIDETRVLKLFKGKSLGEEVSRALEADFPLVSVRDTALRAAEAMIEGAKGKAVVLNDKGLPAGVVTAKDILKLPLVTEEIIELLRTDIEVGFADILGKVGVAKVMSSPAIIAREGDDIGRAIDTMIDSDVGLLPVVNEKEGRFTGVLTRMSLIRTVVREHINPMG
ncbi:MAG: CBS domain-containing protein [Sulfolobales archaeon]|nr:CBS domain-containing protein [Sulfolobales archaeon]